MLFRWANSSRRRGVEGLGGLTRHGVIGGDRAALLDDLAGGVEADDPVEARTVEVSLRGGDVPLERCAGALHPLR